MSSETASTPVRAIPLALAALVPVLIVSPFASKAFHIDDPLYLWAAKQIVNDPFDYYGAIVNKWGTNQPLSDIMVIPPGFPFLLAAFGLVFGWSEFAMHAPVMLSAGLLGAGIYLTASRLCARPGLAPAVAVLTPAFLVSSTTVMTDIPLTAALVWGIYLWLRGFPENRHWLLFMSALFVSAAQMIKYTGVTAVPLLFAYSMLARRRPGLWLIHLAIPLAVLAAYQFTEYRLYGRPQLGYSFEYVQSDYQKSLVADWLQPLVGITFVGGSFASVALLAPLMWRWRTLAAAAIVATGVAAVSYAWAATFLYTTRVSPTLTAALSIQNGFWFAAGLLALALPIADLWRARDQDSALLALWVYGSFAFAAFVNWSINARALLPMLAPLAILVVRQMEPGLARASRRRTMALGSIMAASGALGVALAVADTVQADIARDAARKFLADDRDYPGQYFFEDHWGLQYYLETGGMLYLDDTKLQAHDRIIAPLWGSVETNYDPSMARRVSTAEYMRPAFPGVTTMHPALCAGFYAHTRGPLPFAFGPVPEQEFAVFQVEHYGK